MIQAIDAGLPSLMEDFGSSVLQPLKLNIGQVVERAIHDAMPQALSRKVLADFDSTIVSESQQARLSTLWSADVPVMYPPKLTLLYRASRDGWISSDFHSKCDYKGPTLTVIKCTGGYVFGGYANAAWTSNKDGDH